jgi:hypothetical protein
MSFFSSPTSPNSPRSPFLSAFSVRSYMLIQAREACLFGIHTGIHFTPPTSSAVAQIEGRERYGKPALLNPVPVTQCALRLP